MNASPAGQTAARAVNTALERGSARPVANMTVELGDEADRAAAAISAAFTRLQLQANPIMLWQGPDELLVGPNGVLSPADLIPHHQSRDIRVYRDGDTAARVVLSWLDGPTRDQVAHRLASQPDSGLRVELLREEWNVLRTDVLDACLTAPGHGAQLATHPILDRLEAIRDGRDTYYALLDLGAALLCAVKRRGGRSWFQLMQAIGELNDQELVDCALDDLDVRMQGGVFFQVRAVDAHALLTALFGIAALAARFVPARTRARIRQQIITP